MRIIRVFIYAISVLSICGWQPVLGDVAGETEYSAVFMDGGKIGHVIHIRSVSEREVTTTEEMKMTIARGGFSITVSTTETTIETLDGRPIGFEVVQNMSGIEQKSIGKINSEGKFDVTSSVMGTTQKQTVDFPAGAIMSEGMRLLQMKKGLGAGTTYDAVLFVPSMLSAVNASVVVGEVVSTDVFGRMVNLTEMKVAMHTSGGEMTSTSYVDRDFRAQKTIMPAMGMTLEIIACAKEFALSENDVVDFLDKMLLTSPVPLDNIRSKKSVTYHLVPVNNAKLQIPYGQNQTVVAGKDGRVIVTVRPVRPASGARFPYSGDLPQILEALKPTRYVQSDAKEIIDLGRHAVGSTKDAGLAVKKIESFVNGYITEKDLSVGYASALQVADSRQGDCTEHAVLTAAICRSVGIPARVVTGLVYADMFLGQRGVFGAHAWTEAYVGGKWTGLDATRAPNGYGPGHIALAIGNDEPAVFALAATLGNFKIEKVVIED